MLLFSKRPWLRSSDILHIHMLCPIVKNKEKSVRQNVIKGTFSFQSLGLTDFSEIFTSG